MNMSLQDLVKTGDKSREIGQDRVVQLSFRVTDTDSGELLQCGDDLFYLHGGYGGAFPKVEQAVEGCRVGDRVTVRLTPKEGYGVYQPELVLVLPGTEFAEAMPEAGEAVDGELPDGRSMTFTVAAVDQGQVTLDGNHPFSGKNLKFDLEVIDIRESIEAERAAGFAFDGMFC